MTDDTQKLVDKYNRSVQSIKEQELAIDKVKQKIENLNYLKDAGVVLTDSEYKNLENLPRQLDLMNSKLEDTKVNANEIGKELSQSMNQKHLELFGSKIDGVGKKLDKFKNKISRLVGSAMVFSLLRNQLTSLRNNFITLLKTDDQFSSSLNQVKANLMTAFVPIYNACLPAINSLMNALSKVTGTIAMFTASLLGSGINSATKDAKKLSDALNKVGGSAKKASGSLGSFDTLEVLQSNDSLSGGSAGGNQIDYSGEITYSQGLLNVMNAIADFVKQNKDYILGFLGGIFLYITLIKLGLTGLIPAALSVAVAGLIIAIEGIIGYLDDPSWNNFGKVITGIGLIVGGVAAAFGAWPIAVGGAIAAVLGLIISNWDNIKSFLQNGISWLKESGRSLFNSIFGDTLMPIYDAIVEVLQSLLTYFDEQFTFVKDIFNNIIDFIKNVFTGNWSAAWENVKNIFLDIIKMLLSKFKLALSTIGNLVVGIGKTTGNIIASVFKAVINGVLSAIETVLNAPIKSINKLTGIINKIPGINLGTLPTFNLPRLAKGAVIPPRQEFAAVLGDQKHGTNIEAPLDTIKQANREVLEEVLGRIGINDQDREIVLKNWQFILQFGNTTLAKIVIDEIKKYEKETNTQFLLS